MLKNYGLCPTHYLSTPALRWNGILNMTNFVLRFISDADMSLFCEKGMRVGVFYISIRCSKANKKYLKSITQSKNQAILYDYTMSKFLPTSGFKWIDTKDFDSNRYSCNSSKGGVLEVDLENL